MQRATLCLLLVGCVCVLAFPSHSQSTDSKGSSIRSLSSREVEFIFQKWMFQHRISYGSADEQLYRRSVFHSNLERILSHNANPHKRFTMKMNRFGDLTFDEFRAQHFGLARTRSTPRSNTPSHHRARRSLPTSVDWVAAGKVLPVGDQGQCGSCWAFSAIDPLASAYAIKFNTDPIQLSVQELVDCDGVGCSGGEIDDAYQWIIKNGGICTDNAYHSNGTCAATSCPNVVTLTGIVDVKTNDSVALAEAVAIGPVGAALDASQDFQFYSSGIISDPNCGTELDHTVTIVGYNVLQNQEYWIVKNSWGSAWGMNGYAWVAKEDTTNAPGECGIAMLASYPTGVRKV